jgi:hypothetical protein
MRNLAGDKDCDREIRRELERARIGMVDGEKEPGEVPATVTGKLLGWKFTRAWYYWVAKAERGPGIPPHDASILYYDPVGRDDIRVDGCAGNRMPTGSVNCYHIDSEVGLRVFADTLLALGVRG